MSKIQVSEVSVENLIRRLNGRDVAASEKCAILTVFAMASIPYHIFAEGLACNVERASILGDNVIFNGLITITARDWSKIVFRAGWIDLVA